MADEIEFGEMKSDSPIPGLRPDENHFYAVVGINETVGPEDLPVFVDIDVMRELELHAQANTQVELGGVLMGRQGVDSTGRHFVVVLDSIRAQHFQATRGSFKFTHQTWQQITRDRMKMPADLQMVGWYHTHPGWGVFLSGMDDFICENFFNRHLDLALVLDPLQGEIGWFQWDEQGATRLTSAVYLIGHRHRVDELSDYANELRAGGTMIDKQKVNTSQSFERGTTLQIIERPNPLPWVLAAMMALQWVAILILVWQVGLVTPQRTGGEREVELSSDDRNRLLLLERENQLLSQLVREVIREPGRELSTVQQLAQSELAKERLSAAVDSHLVRIEALSESVQALKGKEETQVRESRLLQEKMSSMEAELAAYKSTDALYSVADGGFINRYQKWISLGVILFLMAIIACGLWFWPRASLPTRRLGRPGDRDYDDELDSDDSTAAITRASASSASPTKRKI